MLAERKAWQSGRLSVLRGNLSRRKVQTEMASEPRSGTVEARHLARELAQRAVEMLYDIMVNRADPSADRLTAATTILNVAQLIGSEAATEMPE
jgi:hypothetical protein